MKRVLISGAFQMPGVDAAATRLFGFSKLFDDTYKVIFAGWEGN